MPEPIFQDAELQARFDTQGYVQIPFLSKEDIDELLKIFWELHPSINNQGFQSSSYSNDFAYKKKASDLVTAIFNKHYERIFKNYRTFGSAFLYKQPDAYSELPIHQDWTIVDEDNFVALNIWVPLIDVNTHNGALHVLPGSQYGIVKPVRCPTVPMFFNGNEQLMIDNSIPMVVKAGEAVVLNQSIVHYSPPNKSDKIRIAITSGVMSEHPKMNFHYCPDPAKDELEVIEMEDDFLISFENFYEAIKLRPVMGKSIGFKKIKPPVYNKEELEELILKMKEKAGMEPVLAHKQEESTVSNTVNVIKEEVILEKGFLEKVKDLFRKTA